MRGRAAQHRDNMKMSDDEEEEEGEMGERERGGGLHFSANFCFTGLKLTRVV